MLTFLASGRNGIDRYIALFFPDRKLGIEGDGEMGKVREVREMGKMREVREMGKMREMEKKLSAVSGQHSANRS